MLSTSWPQARARCASRLPTRLSPPPPCHRASFALCPSCARAPSSRASSRSGTPPHATPPRSTTSALRKADRPPPHRHPSHPCPWRPSGPQSQPTISSARRTPSPRSRPPRRWVPTRRTSTVSPLCPHRASRCPPEMLSFSKCARRLSRLRGRVWRRSAPRRSSGPRRTGSSARGATSLWMRQSSACAPQCSPRGGSWPLI
mmetsp:Transcript_3902/g.11012  ORF Transcript_3902/g.11012 Transcript_3902/m.11012 type:complete len:201 (-) Transcript_3902:510-1112(-)